MEKERNDFSNGDDSTWKEWETPMLRIIGVVDDTAAGGDTNQDGPSGNYS